MRCEKFIELKNDQIVGFKRHKRRWSWLLSKQIVGNLEHCCSVSERCRINSQIKQLIQIRIIQVYAPTSAYGDDDVKTFYEDVEAALELHKIHLSLH